MGRVAFLYFNGYTQSYSMVSYPAVYQEIDAFYSIVFSVYLLPLSLWLIILCNGEKLH